MLKFDYDILFDEPITLKFDYDKVDESFSDILKKIAAL